jgi:hypothetical protein
MAARALGVGVLSNTAVKLGAVLLLGRGGYRRLAGLGLVVQALALGVSLMLS